MRTFLNHLWRVVVASFVLYIVWIISMIISEHIIPSGLKTVEGKEALSAALLYTVCLTHVLVLYIMICHIQWRGFKLVLVVFSLIYFIQFLLSMVETIWFNASLEMPASGIKNIIFSGLLLSAIFSPLFVWISGKFRRTPEFILAKINWNDIFSGTFLIKMFVLIVVIYPMLYNLAGYYIAWQFEAVRLFYTGSTDMEPFGSMLLANIKSGLYPFQILRGFIWLILALPVYYLSEGSYKKKGVIIGLLFATLMNAQHILPNPYFPSEVSFAHFVETYSSNFLWGYCIAWILNWHQGRKLSVAE